MNDLIKKEETAVIISNEEMMDNVIKKYGFEDNRAILFCELVECGQLSRDSLEVYYNLFMD